MELLEAMVQLLVVVINTCGFYLQNYCLKGLVLLWAWLHNCPFFGTGAIAGGCGYGESLFCRSNYVLSGEHYLNFSVKSPFSVKLQWTPYYSGHPWDQAKCALIGGVAIFLGTDWWKSLCSWNEKCGLRNESETGSCYEMWTRGSSVKWSLGSCCESLYLAIFIGLRETAVAGA